MLKPKKNIFRAKSQKNLEKGSIVIDAGSLVYDNQWISYQGTVFSVQNYINNVVNGTTRRRFFNKHNYAIQLLIGIDKSGALQVREGTQVLFTTKSSIPIPATFNIIPLLSVALIQDGSNDLNTGFKPINDSNITFFSGTGNVIDKNLKGEESPHRGITGFQGAQGETGLKGLQGETGTEGVMGITGEKGYSETGPKGVQGMTGINWTIHVPFEIFF